MSRVFFFKLSLLEIEFHVLSLSNGIKQSLLNRKRSHQGDCTRLRAGPKIIVLPGIVWVEPYPSQQGVFNADNTRLRRDELHFHIWNEVL